MNTVEQQFENKLSPRAQAFFAWCDKHTQSYIEPTQKPTEHHGDRCRVISEEDREELFEFDVNAANRNAFGLGICSSM
jgi:hypothetical protein